MLKRTNFYKFKPLFRYLKYVFTHLFQLYFPEFGFKGIKLKKAKPIKKLKSISNKNQCVVTEEELSKLIKNLRPNNKSF